MILLDFKAKTSSLSTVFRSWVASCIFDTEVVELAEPGVLTSYTLLQSISQQ